ncbi:uncharacterized protein LOC144170095 [Haemaphysalis longicornis]
MLRTAITALLVGSTVLATFLDDEKPFDRGEPLRMEREPAFHYERGLRHSRPVPHRYAEERGWGSGSREPLGRAARVRPGPIYIIRTLNPEPGPGPQEAPPYEPPPWQGSSVVYRAGPKSLPLAEGSNVQYVVFVDRGALPIDEPTLVDAYHGRLRKVHRWSPEVYKSKA